MRGSEILALPMSTAVFLKLVALFVVVFLGWLAGMMRWFGKPGPTSDPARVLSAAAFYVFVPALLFRTTVRIDLRTLPWSTLAAYFVPVIALLLGVYVSQRARLAHGLAPAGPGVRAITATFGNTVQIGVPMALALFGEAGLGIHVTLVSVHALFLMTLTTALVELDLARDRRRSGRSGSAGRELARTLGRTVRNTVIHPVVLPVATGLLWNLAGLPLPAFVDEILQMLAQAVVPLCLMLIGLSLATYGVRGSAQGAVALTLVKLLLVPAAVLVVAHWGAGLSGLPLSVLVIAAALPSGSITLIFAQRYRVLEGESTAAIVFSTLGFLLAAPLWLLVLSRLS